MKTEWNRRRGYAGRRLSGRRLRVALGLLAVCALACRSEVDPAAVSASIVAFGEFEIRGGLPTLTAQTTKIACEQGRMFGVDYRIDVAGGGYGTVPVEFRWVHPELAVPSRRLWGPETEASTPQPRLEWRESSLEGRVLWSLDHVDELVAGRYEFQVRLVGNGGVILSQAFEVEGC